MENTIDVLGDAIVFKSLVEKTIESFVDEELTSIGTYAFESCSNLQSVSLPNATSIGKAAFYYCINLQSVSFPNATSIGTYVFESCSNLRSVSLPNATSIGTSAFISCIKLQTLVVGTEKDTVCTLGNSKAIPSNSGLSIYVPDALVDAYKGATNWSTHASKIKPISNKP